MADDSAEYDPMEATNVLGSTENADSMTSTAMLPTLLIEGLASEEFAEPDALTVALVRQCPSCGLMYSADYDNCAVDGAPLAALMKGLGGSLPGGVDAAPRLQLQEDDAYDFDDTSVRQIRDDELGAVVDETIRGTVLDGRFYVEELIGEGGMGRVYRGSQLSVGRVVAIKVLHRRISNDASIRERFNREARLVSGFSHPNTVRLIEFGEANGHLYMAMEYVEGVSLQAFAGRAPLNVGFALEILRQVCGPLAEAHKAEIVHRDLKPENLYITRSADGRLQVKLLDFGVAHIDPSTTADQADTYRELTKQGVVIGTPEYMAPEQARGESVSTTTDIYSLGVLLYQMLSGELPFSGQTPMHTMFQLVTKPVPPITDHIPDCPLPLVQLVEELLQKQPDRRLRSVVQLARRIREVELALKLSPLAELESGDLQAVLAGLVFEDSAAQTQQFAQPEHWIPDTEKTPAVESFDLTPQALPADEQATRPTPVPAFEPRPDPEPLAAVLRPARAPVTLSEGAVEPEAAPPKRVAYIEPTAEVATTRPRKTQQDPEQPLRVRANANPTTVKPYVPPDVATEAIPRSRAGLHLRIILLALLLVGVTAAVGWAMTSLLLESAPPEAPAVLPTEPAPPANVPAAAPAERAPAAVVPPPMDEPAAAPEIAPVEKVAPTPAPKPKPPAEVAKPASVEKPKPAEPAPVEKPPPAKPEAKPEPEVEPTTTTANPPAPPVVIRDPEPDPPKVDEPEADDAPTPSSTNGAESAPPALIIEGGDDPVPDDAAEE